MDTNGEPGQGRHSPRQRGSLRRRVVFELEEGQLPLLEAAEARHGSKRSALLAALEAEEGAAELTERAERAEAELAHHEEGAKAKKDKAEAKLKRELAGAEKKLAKAEEALAAARKEGSDGEAALRREAEELGEALAERDEELAELRPRAVDWLFCARCGKWVGPEQWAWEEFEEGGSYAYHAPCGDHDLRVRSSSWLAQRA